MSRRVEIVKRLLDRYNDRDWDTLRAVCAEDMTFYDNAFNVGGTSRDEFIRFSQRLLEEAPDMRVFDISFIDADNARVVISTATYQGTHTGPPYLPGLETSGRQEGTRTCEIWRFDEQDRVIGNEIFNDMLAKEIELGDVTLPEATVQALNLQVPPRVAMQYSS
jgi:steroid delta-isomerase-like uncharacterized protein